MKALGARNRIRLAVLFGGAIGTFGRYAMGLLVGDDTWPWATFLVNVGGSAALGAAIGVRVRHPLSHPLRFAFFGVGVLGAFTTFGGFAVQVVDRIQRGHIWWALIYLGTSVVAGMSAAIGMKRVTEETP